MSTEERPALPDEAYDLGRVLTESRLWSSIPEVSLPLNARTTAEILEKADEIPTEESGVSRLKGGIHARGYKGWWESLRNNKELMSAVHERTAFEIDGEKPKPYISLWERRPYIYRKGSSKASGSEEKVWPDAHLYNLVIDLGAAYSGGELLVMNEEGEWLTLMPSSTPADDRTPGLRAVMFPHSMPHQVTPITGGTRIVAVLPVVIRYSWSPFDKYFEDWTDHAGGKTHHTLSLFTRSKPFDALSTLLYLYPVDRRAAREMAHGGRPDKFLVRPDGEGGYSVVKIDAHCCHATVASAQILKDHGLGHAIDVVENAEEPAEYAALSRSPPAGTLFSWSPAWQEAFEAAVEAYDSGCESGEDYDTE